jgi:hypothetical protein
MEVDDSQTKLKNLIILDKNITNLTLPEILCQLCDDIVQNPVRCKDCNYLYCSDCAHTLKNKRKNCLNILHPKNSKLVNLISDTLLNQKLETEINFHCKNNCNFITSSIPDISFHLIDCKLILKMCPNQNCDFKGTDEDLLTHSYSCKHFSIKCSVCAYKLNSLEEQARHNCMTKIVEECTMLQDVIHMEREKLENFIKEKRKNLLDYAEKNNITLTYCLSCKGNVQWLSSIDKISDQAYHMCSSMNQFKKDECTKTFRFYCDKCRIAFCTNCLKLKPKEICYCGKKMIREVLINHYCDVCEKTIVGEAFACHRCLYDICLECLDMDKKESLDFNDENDMEMEME